MMISTQAETAALALRDWGIAPRALVLVRHDETAVFKVVARDGRRYALRLHGPGCRADKSLRDRSLRSELQWMEALRAEGIDVPAGVPTSDGALFSTIALGGGGTAQVDLFEWSDGVPLATWKRGAGGDGIAGTYRTIGAIAARLHRHALQWELPAGFYRHAWDLEGLVGEQPLWGRFWELPLLNKAQKRLLLKARDSVAAQLRAMPDMPDQAPYYGLIHADCTPENLLVADGTVRLPDFGHAGFGWHMFELATTLYCIEGGPHYGTARDALVAGYRSVRDLPDTVLATLQVFMAARGFTYLGWLHTRNHPEMVRDMGPALVAQACRLAEAVLAC